MCLAIPMQVVALAGDGDLAWVERAGRRQLVNMMLIGPQPPGAWVLTSLGLAREVVEPGQLALIEEALAALAASLAGDHEPGRDFSDLQPK
jgi:hydrogenase expression/formation protein HypC